MIDVLCPYSKSKFTTAKATAHSEGGGTEIDLSSGSLADADAEPCDDIVGALEDNLDPTLLSEDDSKALEEEEGLSVRRKAERGSSSDISDCVVPKFTRRANIPRKSISAPALYPKRSTSSTIPEGRLALDCPFCHQGAQQVVPPKDRLYHRLIPQKAPQSERNAERRRNGRLMSGGMTGMVSQQRFGFISLSSFQRSFGSPQAMDPKSAKTSPFQSV